MPVSRSECENSLKYGRFCVAHLREQMSPELGSEQTREFHDREVVKPTQKPTLLCRVGKIDEGHRECFETVPPLV
jgi:hypothetical protein